jgi:hypothetical protein
VLAGDADLQDRVLRLVAAETSCCSFFTFGVTELGPDDAAAAGGTRIALDIAVPPARADVLAALVERAAASVDRAARVTR